MLFRSNLLAVVGGGMSSKFDEKAVIIWDESKPASEKILLDITFAQPILAVRMLKEKLVVVLRQEIHIFSFPSKIERLHTIDTKDNPRGLCEVSAFGAMMVFPAVNRGHVQLVNLENIHPGQTASPVIISAHKSDIACVAISQCGSFIATASVKGTLIRVFDAATRKLIVELRRGADTAMFYCISFSPDASFLCASSDKGTVHIFAVKDTTLNRRSTFKSMGFLGPYVESQWGLANFTVSSECPCVCAFTDNQTVVAACVDGTFHKYVFTMDGNCNRDSFDVFLEMGEDMD
ncbi:WD repeat domain phosphoinositide-interacting protein 4-like [Pomacea canaliculata]|uniref:WD repeat domain phosphoinositide-interacting protein 4-like n=1 Tax=Pomacea canaliculata TaxID=400727 RepID=UPI000D727D1A|nr:WD repeat domain phosphoinositide-interacting protein 4-like [Pomacea canaliculata]XP_025076275.1 WD repeat domain phosphoinositide-interacting protein 4-like [Pomacea canaliculata]XP_025076285.1 WD repeat domain phosphoinositide-interacting protein 4-like [Pomacea canaliculata]XP_025076293.1 WD repeat domain phosphoinositide-interacting protein 4-like [Pomacea canaliculata]